MRSAIRTETKLRHLVLGALLALLSGPVFCEELPSVLKNASALELQGRLSEALETYQIALHSEAFLRTEANEHYRIALRKSAFLSIDLGQYENAWDLGTRLLALGTPASLADGLLVQWRILRSVNNSKVAWELYKTYFARVAKPPLPLIREALWIAVQERQTAVEQKLRSLLPVSTEVESWTILLGPSESEAKSSFTIPKRLQIGAYRDWNNALTQWNALKDRGWQAFVDRKSTATSVLFSVFVVSSRSVEDLKRLKSSGFEAVVLP